MLNFECGEQYEDDQYLNAVANRTLSFESGLSIRRFDPDFFRCRYAQRNPASAGSQG
jgi:hypothetical protein